MRGSRALSATAGVAVAFTAAAIATAPPAWAHKHPTPVELDSPGVVYVETSARVQISLIEHNRLGQHIGLVQRTYTPVLATGSGFAVDPTGAVVTTGTVVSPDLQRAAIFAVNSLFHERYGSAAPMPSDPFAEHTIADLQDDPVNARLQRCYQPNTADNTGGCVVAVTREVRVYPYVTSQQSFGALPAEVLTPKPGTTADVAVLRVGASSMPTVNLAPSAAGAMALSVLGFTGVPGNAHQLATVDAHLTKAGGDQVKHDEFFTRVSAQLRNGMAGGPVVAEKGQVVGFLAAPSAGSSEPTLVSASTVRAALKSVGVTPQRGPVDAVFEDASHSFKNGLFAASVPSLLKTLQLYPGHFIAAQDLKAAQAKAGTAADLTGQSSGAPATTTGTDNGGLSTVWLVVIAVGAALVVAVVTGFIVLQRRRRQAKPATGPEPHPGGRPRAPQVPASRKPGDPIRFVEPSVSTAAGSSGAGSSGAGSSGAGSSAAGRSSAPPPEPPPDDHVHAPSGSRARSRSSVLPRPENGAASRTVTRYCTNCGQPLATAHRFCGRCGHAADGEV